MTSKNVLMTVGVVVLLMGLWAVLANYIDLPTLDAVEPLWHSIAKMVVGAFAVYVAYTDK